jgi:hypothetical protein
MDAHKIDGIFCILLPQPSGDFVEKIIHRIWVIVLIEITSRAVLGYHMSLRKEVNQEDTLRAIKHALTKWHPMEITYSDHPYADGAGFPSSMDPTFTHACWDELSVDGAMAECSKSITFTLTNLVGAKLINPAEGFSARRNPNDRPFIESFFRQISTKGFDRMSNTTGAKPEDIRGQDPKKVAVNSRFQIEYAQEILDVLIANYNATPHSALGYRSPLQYLKFLKERGDVNLRYAEADSIQSMLSFRKLCTVRGGLDTGRRPYINFEGAKYTGC